MNQMMQCDWLPERARWSYLARSGLPTMSLVKDFRLSQIMNPLLSKLFLSRWLDIGLVLGVYGPRLCLGSETGESILPQNKRKYNCYSSYLDYFLL